MVTCWFAVDIEGRLAAFEIGEFGARPEHALRLEAIDPELLEGWWGADGQALLRFAHVATDPGGLYKRIGGAGTVRLEDAPQDLREPLSAIALPVDLSQSDVIDLVKLIPEQLLIGQEIAPPETDSPLELRELFAFSGTRLRMGRNRDRLKPDTDEDEN